MQGFFQKEGSKMKLEVINLSGQRIISKIFIKKWVQQVFRELKKRKIKVSGQQLSLVFLNAIEMKKLNRMFRSKNKPTDVLSFSPSGSLSSKRGELGEIVLCTSYIKKMNQGSVRERTAYAILHGILHLLGFEHEKDIQSAQKMYHIQDQIFETFYK